jgi:lantibiotic modifying enzyme
MAHGMAGALHSLLQWHEASQQPLNARISKYLCELARLGIKHNDAVAWPRTRKGEPPWGGWCHGSAGYLLLWLTAFRVFGEKEYRHLAFGAAQHVWETRNYSTSSLCCGLAGQALALARCGLTTNEVRWNRRARVLLSRAVQGTDLEDQHSLFRGRLGVTLAEIEIGRRQAAWPLLQSPLYESAGP